MSDARTVVLGRIRAALSAAPPEIVPIPRGYDREPLDGHADIDLFAETVADYRARVLRIRAADGRVRFLERGRLLGGDARPQRVQGGVDVAGAATTAQAAPCRATSR